MSPMVGRGERATPPQRHVVADGQAVFRQIEASAHSLPTSERALRSCAPALLISCRPRRSFKEVACSRPDRPSETWMSTMSLQGRTCGVSVRATARCLHPRNNRSRRPAWPQAKGRGLRVKQGPRAEDPPTRGHGDWFRVGVVGEGSLRCWFVSTVPPVKSPVPAMRSRPTATGCCLIAE